MDAGRLDTLARNLTTAGTRRRALAALSGVVGLILVSSSRSEVAAKPCPPCKKRKAGKCKKKKPDGTACPGGTCQRGGCVATAAPPPLPCGGCPGGQTCLSNGSCAIPCPTGDGDCPFNRCASCDRNAEQQQYCSDGLTAPCTAYQICTLPAGTSACPKGTQCQSCVGSPEYRCIPLCTG